jgi:hypothetical protein
MYRYLNCQNLDVVLQVVKEFNFGLINDVEGRFIRKLAKLSIRFAFLTQCLLTN